MADILEYPFITPYYYATKYVKNSSMLVRWLLNGRLAENPVVVPKNYEQVIIPSAQNRYLQSVTITNKFPRVYTAEVAVGSTVTTAVPGASIVTSDADTIATATVSGEVVTTTGVAEGTTVIRVYNGSDILVGLIVVTVTA